MKNKSLYSKNLYRLEDISPSEASQKKSEQERIPFLLASNLARAYFLPLPFSHLFSDFSHLLSEAFIVSLNERLTIRETVGFDVILVSLWIGWAPLFSVFFPFVTAISISLLPLIGDRVFHSIAGIIIGIPKWVVAPIPEWVIGSNKNDPMRSAYDSTLSLSRSSEDTR